MQCEWLCPLTRQPVLTTICGRHGSWRRRGQTMDIKWVLITLMHQLWNNNMYISSVTLSIHVMFHWSVWTSNITTSHAVSRHVRLTKHNAALCSEWTACTGCSKVAKHTQTVLHWFTLRNDACCTWVCHSVWLVMFAYNALVSAPTPHTLSSTPPVCMVCSLFPAAHCQPTSSFPGIIRKSLFSYAYHTSLVPEALYHRPQPYGYSTV